LEATIDVMENIEEAAKLLREAAWYLNEEGVLEMDFEIGIKAQRPTSTVTLNTEPGEMTAS